jgi:hypothetical protein
MRSSLLLVGAVVLLAGCAERPLLDSSQPAITGQARAVSRADLARVVKIARQHLVETGRASHVIYSLDVTSSRQIIVEHDQPPKHAGDTFEEFVCERSKGRWQITGREIVHGVNLPTG